MTDARTESTPGARALRARRTWVARLARCRGDLALAGSLCGLATLAWCLPESYWDRVCHNLALLQPWRIRGRRLASFGYAASSSLKWSGLSADACARAQLANVYRERMQLLACYCPGRRPPRARLEGGEHLEAALGEGKGAVLWIAPFVFSSLFTKMAIHDAGFAVSHLSRHTHGFSSSRVGGKLLNPIRTSIECRYLSERLVMRRGESTTTLRKLIGRLRANRIVSISALGAAYQLYRIPFLNGSIQMAGGAPSLAVHSGAALLPVFTGRDPDGDWITSIEPPLIHREIWERNEAVGRLLLQYAALLEYYVARWPDQLRPGALHFKAD